MIERPSIVVLAGPNGAGKSTVAPVLLAQTLGIGEFVNADDIARGLSAFQPQSVAIAAGRVMLARLDELARQGVSFAFETTLASRSFRPWLEARIMAGYRVHLLFLWLPSPEMAAARVAYRVARGGHGVADEVIRRRYAAGLHNFFALYRSIAEEWRFYDSHSVVGPRLLAQGNGSGGIHVLDSPLWADIVRQWGGS